MFDDVAHGSTDRDIAFGQARHVEILLVVDQDASLGVEHIEAVAHVVERILEQLALQVLRRFAEFEFPPRVFAFGDVVMDDDKSTRRTRIA